MKISMIAAIGFNRELGYRNQLIWKIPEDIKRFRRLTSGHSVIMGRKTFESIGRLLPNRTNIVVTRDPNYKVEGAVIVNSIEEALRQAQGDNEEVFIIGGAQIYSSAINLADKLYLTKINSEAPLADTFFPDYSNFTKVVFQESHMDDGLEYEFLTLEK